MALSLTRYLQEQIVVRTPSEQIVITVEEFRGPGRVILSVSAPDYCTINRGEIQARIDNENGNRTGDNIPYSKPSREQVIALARKVVAAHDAAGEDWDEDTRETPLGDAIAALRKALGMEKPNQSTGEAS